MGELNVQSVQDSGKRVKAVARDSQRQLNPAVGEPIFFRVDDVRFDPGNTYEAFTSDPLRPVGVVQKVLPGDHAGESLLDLELNVSYPLKAGSTLLTTNRRGAFQDAKRLSDA